MTGPGTVSAVVMTPVAGSPGQFTVRNTSAPQTVGAGPQLVELATSQPIMQGVWPSFGPATGGTQVTLTGQSFDQATSVTFDGVAAQSFTVVDAQTIQAVTPAVVAAGPVTVQASNGSRQGVGLASGFADNRVCTVPNRRRRPGRRRSRDGRSP